MCKITVSGKGTEVTPALREHVETAVNEASSVFDISPMSCEVVLRFGKGRPKREANTCEMVLRVPKSVVRVSESGEDMYAAIDAAASKVSRQLRKYKTKVIDKSRKTAHASKRAAQNVPAVDEENFDELIVDTDVEEIFESDALVREKIVDISSMSYDEALVQIDLLGHDFYMFEDSRTGLVCVAYKRHDGGYGILRPKVAFEDVA